MTVTVAIRDLAGRTIRVASQPAGQAGLQQWRWDGLDDSGNRVQPGVYLVSLKGRNATQSQTVVVLE
jgi:flagellar hook assembly protein FlgD